MDMSKRNFRGKVTCLPLSVDSNAGQDFANMRKHGADGSIPQAFGCSKLSAWVGDDHYETERMTAGRANGSFQPEVISRGKQIVFDTGHDYEKSIAQHNCTIMTVRSGITVIPHDASKEEWRNDEWSGVAAHMDFYVQVVKGEIIPNPNYVIGGPEKNYKIIPSSKDHWYVGDSKSVQSHFGSNWAEKDENGIPINGMKYGIAPVHYRQQMLGYLATVAPLKKFEGAVLFAACGFSEHDHAQVFIPFDEEAQTEAEALMDEVEAKNNASYHGQIPSVRDCKDVAKAIEELPLQYPDVNADKKLHELKGDKWKSTIDRIAEIDAELADLDSKFKPMETEFREKSKDLKKSIDDLKDEKKKLIAMPLEEVQDGPGCFYIDEATGDVVNIMYSSGIKWDMKAKTALVEDYPEIAEDLRHRFPERKPSYSRLSSGAKK